MGLSQRLLVLLYNTVRFTIRATTPTQTTSTKKRQVSTSTTSPPSTPTSSLYIDTRNDNDDREFYPLSTTTTCPQETIVIAVIGRSDIDKSSLIHCGFSSAVVQQDMKNTSGVNTNIRQHSVMLNLNNKTGLRHIMFLELDHDLENHDLTTISVHAAIICYDVTQRQSMDGEPDLLNYCHFRRLPVFLLGLIKSDLTASRHLDFTLGQQLAHQHRVPFYEMVMDDASNIQHVFMKLVHQCVNPRLGIITTITNTDDNSNSNSDNNNNIHTCTVSPPESFSSCSSCCSTTAAAKTDDNDVNTQTIISATKEADNFQHPVETNNDRRHHHHHHHHYQTLTTTPTLSSPSRPTIKPIAAVFSSGLSTPSNEYRPSMGFSYVPTPVIKTHGSVQVRHENPSSESLSSSRKISTDNFTNYRRGSKDSSESFGHGLTVDDIIDRLVSPEIDRGDEQMIPIFIIFFRKFMTPFALIQALTNRFQDHMCMPVLPTPQQLRITSVLISWMTDYWCDFYHQRTRHHLDLFLGRLSATMKSSAGPSTSTPLYPMLSMQNIVDTLYSLSYQPVPASDPDSFWAKKNDDDAATKIRRDKKKEIQSTTSYSGTSHSSHTIRSPKDGPLDGYAWTKLPSTTEGHLPPSNDAQYAPSSQPSGQRCPLAPAQNSTLSYASTSLPSLPMTPRSTTATLSSPMHSRSNLTPSTDSLQNRHHSPVFSNRPTNTITPRQKTATKPIAALPSHTSMTQPKFAGGTIQFDYSHMNSLTPAPPTPNINLDQYRRYIYHRHEQTMKYSSIVSSSSSSSSSLSLPSRSFMSSTLRTSTPPPQLSSSSSSSSPLSFRSLHPTLTSSPATSVLLNQNYSNNNKSRFLHKWLLSTSVNSRPNAVFSSPTCTDTSAPSSMNSNPLAFKYNTKFILSLSEHDMADQLTWIEAELFGEVKSREFVRMIWSNHDSKPVHPKQQQTQTGYVTSFSSQEVDRQPDKNDAMVTKSGLLASISHFNFISAWVISMLVTQPKLAKRVALLEKFMMIAVVLRDLNNYNTLMAILAGINNASILRLKQTQEAIKKKKIYKRFQSLEKLMGSDRSYCSYRLALKASTTCPSIPYLGIHSQDLIALAEANKDVKTDGTIHWEKFRLMGDCIMMIMKLQQPKHKVVPDQMILTWLADFSILTEEEQYQQSMQIEPRLKTSKSMNHLRELWLKI